MERESFEDEETAALMNERFVCIKVDREERPDVDRIYMEACQAINGSGGWPLNAFLLPDARPFYAGTYYPPVAKFNRPSWKDVLVSLSTSYHDNHAEVVKQAERLTQNIDRGGHSLLSVEPDAADHHEWRTSVLDKIHHTYDDTNGGFGTGQKFPMSQTLEALLLHGVAHERPGDVATVEHATLAMLDGGLYDQLGGGFSRYTVDRAWRVPHFEKMLYDNALLLRLLAKLHLVAPNPRYVTAIEQTTEWLQREMLLPSGGYRAALDADSEGVEGKYYVWRLEEIEGLLDSEQARLVIAFYGLTEAGNWEEERTNIPYRPMTLEACAQQVGLPVDVARAQLAEARTVLHDHRFKTRVHPGEDDKVILQWNSLLVSAFTWAYRATADDRYTDLATQLYQTIENQLFNEGGWFRNITGGHLGAPAFLDDLAALAEAQLDLYAVTFDDRFIGWSQGGTPTDSRAGGIDDSTARPPTPGAMGTAQAILGTFAADRGPMFLLKPRAGDELPVASIDLFDNALPSGNGQFMRCLLRLGRLLDRPDFTTRGEEMLAAMAGSMQRYPTSFGGWLHAALEHAVANEEMVVTGPGAQAAARSLLSRYRPGLLIVATETPKEDVPLFKNRYLTDGLRFYHCHNQVCSQPATSLTSTLAQLDQLS